MVELPKVINSQRLYVPHKGATMQLEQQIDKCGKDEGENGESQTQNLSQLPCLICLVGFICPPPAYIPMSLAKKKQLS